MLTLSLSRRAEGREGWCAKILRGSGSGPLQFVGPRDQEFGMSDGGRETTTSMGRILINLSDPAHHTPDGSEGRGAGIGGAELRGGSGF